MKLLSLLIVAATAATDYFLQFTDQHYDWKYIEGGNPVGTICHSSEKGEETAGHYGYIDCQSPPALVDITAYEASQMFPDPQFILVTGDLRIGIATTYGENEIKDSIKNVTDIMKKYFPGKKIYFQFGNHDVHPNNAHSPNNTWMYEYAAQQWKEYLTDEARTTLAAKGYYKNTVEGDYTIIGLNTCYLEKSATPCTNISDPAGMIAWLDETLAELETKGEKAYIMGHCYFESNDLHGSKLDAWVDVMRKRKNAIEALFFGHAHTDYFQLIMDKKGYKDETAVPVGVAYVCPSVTPRPSGPHNHMPAFRVYRRNSGKMELLSHETYFMDLDAANNKNDTTFHLEYKTTDTTVPELTMPSPMTPEGWFKVWNNIVAGGEPIIREYWRRYNVGNILDTDEMSAATQRTIMCLTRYGSDAEAYKTCRNSGW